VVAAELGQIGEIIDDGKTGLLYPAGDLKALIARCEKLLANRQLRTRLGTAALKRVHRDFTWDKNAARVVEIARVLKVARKGQPGA
jgi:glycosyltransferase involved in cell wall biosynthesis